MRALSAQRRMTSVDKTARNSYNFINFNGALGESINGN